MLPTTPPSLSPPPTTSSPLPTPAPSSTPSVVTMCSNNAQLIYQAPAVPGFSSVMVLCDDPSDQTCEKDMESLCPENFHLCSYLEFNALNDNWNTEVSSRKRPVGEIHCTSFGRT